MERQGVGVGARDAPGVFGPPVVEEAPDGGQDKLPPQGLADLDGDADLHRKNDVHGWGGRLGWEERERFTSKFPRFLVGTLQPL